MNILGIGTDIVNIKRMEKTIKKYGLVFKNRIFSKKEINYCETKKKSKRFLCKKICGKRSFQQSLGYRNKKRYKLKKYRNFK